MNRFTKHWWKAALSVFAALALLGALAIPLLNGGVPDKVRVALAQTTDTLDDRGGEQDGLEDNVGDTDASGGGGLSEGDTGGGGGGGGGGGSSTGNLSESIKNVTFDLALESAKIEDFDLDDDDLEFVRFTFADDIDEINDDSGFKLRGLDSDEIIDAEEAYRDEDNHDSVLAGFEKDTDLESFTLAMVDANAVENVSSEGNTPDAIELDGSKVDIGEGVTDGPDLLHVSTHPSLERAFFVFDENMDEDTTPSASEMGFYTLDGEIHTADRVASIEDKVVTVVFNEDDGDQVEEAARWFVLEGATKDASSNENPLNATDGRTTAPDLVSVDKGPGDTQFDFEFDEDITSADPAMFLAYTSDGDSYKAESVSRPDSDTVRAAFPEIFEFGEDIILASVEPGAVKADKGFDTPNTAGSERVSSSGLGDGMTTGPDLENADVDEDSGQVIFTFDELVDEDQTWDAANFFVITASGALLEAEDVVETDGEDVIVTFDPTAVQAAEGVVVDDGAVEDFQGNPNPMDAIDIGGGSSLSNSSL